MNSLKKAFGTSKVREEEGTWVDVSDEIRVKLRRFNSRVSKDTMKEYEKGYRAVGKKKLNPEQIEELVTKVIAKAIIADWEGVTDEDGKDIPCTFENKYAILSDEEMADFREFVANAANDRDVFAKELDADAEGN